MRPRIAIAIAALVPAVPAWAVASLQQEKGTPEEAAAKMIEAWKKAGAPNENHRLLDVYVGEWTTTGKMWMDPEAPPMETTGTATGKSIFGGRFVEWRLEGTGPMGPSQGVATIGYDNLKKKFTAVWVESQSTSITTCEGTYDAGKKAFEYRGSYVDAVTGKSIPFRFTESIADKDRITFQWFENHEGKEVKTMEASYTRKK
jgi:hypothetical protein